MQGERMALLQASLEAIKEKMRSFQLFRNNCENRLSSLQTKGWPREARSEHSPSGIDGLLAQSQHLTSSLRRVEGTSVANLRRLEQHVGASLQQQQGRFLQVEQRLLGMLSQKEKVLRNVVLQCESHSHAIKGIQEWIATDHSRGNSFAIVEQALKERMDMAARATEMKIGVLQEKMNYLQSLQESANVARRQLIEERGQGLQQVEAARKEMRRRVNQLQGRLETESSRLAVELQRVETGLLAKIERSGTKIEEMGVQIQKERKGMESALAAEVAALKQTIQSLSFSSPSPTPSYPNANKPASSAQQRQKPILYQQRELLTSPLSQGQSQNNFPHSRRYNDDYPPKRMQFQSLEKKPLPPKKNLFAGAEVDNSAYESERSGREMSGGIRGLLQKSKEKQTRRQGLSRQKSSGKKGLPPVREDPFARRKKQQVLRQESEGQREEVVYEIDEQGYLMDQQGNYLLNEHGEMIRLSPEEIQQYMDEGPQY